MSDIGAVSRDWWFYILQQVENCYERWLLAGPVARLRPHPGDAGLPAEFQLVEQRGIFMLLLACPEMIKRDLVASRALSRLTMEAIRDYAEVLQVEAEELGLSTNAKIFAPADGTSATPAIKALQASPQHGATPLTSSTSTKALCKHWRSEDGCRRGASCTYLHDTENMRDRTTSKRTVRTRVKLAVVVIQRPQENQQAQGEVVAGEGESRCRFGVESR